MSLCHEKSQFPISILLAGWQETLGLLPAGWQETKKSPASRLAGDTSIVLSWNQRQKCSIMYVSDINNNANTSGIV